MCATTYPCAQPRQFTKYAGFPRHFVQDIQVSIPDELEFGRKRDYDQHSLSLSLYHMGGMPGRLLPNVRVAEARTVSIPIV